MTFDLSEIRKVIREEVKKAVLEALTELVPYVSDEEQEEIERIAGKPEDYSEEDFEEWYRE